MDHSNRLISLWIICILLFVSSCGKNSGSISAPNLPAEIKEPLKGSELISEEEYDHLIASKRLKVLSKNEVDKDLLITGAQVGLDINTVSEFVKEHPDLKELLPEDNSSQFMNEGENLEKTNAQGRTFYLNDNYSKLHILAKSIENIQSDYYSSKSALNSISLQSNTNPVSSCDSMEIPQILSLIDWPLKGKVPCIKNQAIRGTCTAFATTTALETLLAKMNQKYLPLSEQGLYAYGKMFWPINGQYDDGYNVYLYLKKSREEGFRIPFSRDWTYNVSTARKVINNQFEDSCKNYGEFCSETAHQGKLYCAKTHDNYYVCGHVTQVNDLSLGVQIKNYVELWNPLNRQNSIDQLKQYLQLGFPGIGEFVILTRFYLNVSGFVMPLSSQVIDHEIQYGNHAMAIVGYISHDQIKDLAEKSLNPTAGKDKLSLYLPDAVKDSKEGFFVFSNSWGNNWGDLGYVYLPESYLLKYTNYLAVVLEYDYKE